MDFYHNLFFFLLHFCHNLTLHFFRDFKLSSWALGRESQGATTIALAIESFSPRVVSTFLSSKQEKKLSTWKRNKRKGEENEYEQKEEGDDKDDGVMM